MSYPGDLFSGGGVLPLSRDAVSVFYSSSQLVYHKKGRNIDIFIFILFD